MPDRIVVCAGTKRGLFLLESDSARDRWRLSGPFLKGWEIFHAIVDTRRTPTVHAAAVQGSFGTNVMTTDLRARKFKAARHPPIPPKLLPSHLRTIRKWGISAAPRVWHLEPGRSSERGVLYVGTGGGHLFHSPDSGRRWKAIASYLPPILSVTATVV